VQLTPESGKIDHILIGRIHLFILITDRSISSIEYQSTFSVHTQMIEQ
jgi:hypothetical protein